MKSILKPIFPFIQIQINLKSHMVRQFTWKSWKKLIRICGWVIRFITNVRRSVDEKIVGEFLPSEVKDAENWFIRSAQGESFAEEYRLL